MSGHAIDLERYPMHSPVNEQEAKKALQMAYALAYRQWKNDDERIALDEYQDAALTALTGCLERYHPAGKSFSSYAYVTNGVSLLQTTQ
jgi:hypothetical protein